MRSVARFGILFAVAAGSAFGEVADSAPGGFTVKLNASMKATPDALYSAFVKIGDWWSPMHTFSGDSSNLTIEPRAQGCFCEAMPDGGGIRHLEVIAVVPGNYMILSGALGPMQPLAVTGTLVVRFSPVGDETSRIDVTYTAAGYVPGGLNVWAQPADGMLAEQLPRLKKFVETGKPE